MFKHERKESESIVKARDEYSAVICDHDVFVSVDDDGTTSVSIAPNNWQDGLRLPMLKFHPKNVAELERLADVGPDLFRKVAAELRAIGKEDLRSKWDKMSDDTRKRWEKAS